ncbi:MAG: sulfite exporter TauE/SafE family protein [Desulfarculaceae bacterium]|nr:sulfite exporter TauE/SafE family protein [Desulfarculaceae bacterium]MCF8074313.1 sulfite exporter TauE/SafE family protein [Desulfarculaceae bacterium]MCF8103381.1 sulfite exporter TauE/SafE family protein [Desulfarculaceae bacterium]MCF8117764.1 sulfite exporter TauE/SafE family protein [Desulfarculaceae bacterium]
MDWLYMHMPIAGVDIFWPGLLLIGYAVGVIGGFFGMGGAWMVTPGLNILGFPMAFAIGTDIAHIAGKSMISTMRHSKFGNVDYKLGFIMLIGTMAGIELGAQIVMILERQGSIGSVVRWVYVGFLALIALMVFYDYFKAVRSKTKSDDPSHTGATGGVNWAPAMHKINIPPMMHFKVAGIHCSMWLPVMVSFITGVLAGFLGIGGGLLRMPALVYFIGAPTHVAVGTDLFEVMISGLYGAFTYSLKGRIELVAVFVMLCGAAVGAQIGTVATKYAKGYGIRLMFGCAVLACMVSIILKQFNVTALATVIILGAITAICVYIMSIMFRGAANELREKRLNGSTGGAS